MIDKLVALFGINATGWLISIFMIGSGLLSGWWMTQLHYRAEVAALKQSYAEAGSAAASAALARLQRATQKGDELAAQVAASDAKRIQLAEEKDREINRLATGRACLSGDLVRLLNGSGSPGLRLPEAPRLALDADTAVAAYPDDRGLKTVSEDRGQMTEDSRLPARSAAVNPTKAKPSLTEQSSVLSPLSSEHATDTDIARWARNARDQHDACRERIAVLRTWLAE